MNLEIQIAAAKIAKYAASESGDSLELIERPNGGISIVLADGQRSGKSAKTISNLVVRKAISLLAEGVRDGAAARAAHDYLYTYRGGKVSATLNMLSVDLVTKTIVVSRNSHCPVWVSTSRDLCCLDEPCQPVGIYPRTKPAIAEMPIEPDMYVIIYTDGIPDAGRRSGKHLDLEALLPALLAHKDRSAQSIADALLGAAVELDDGRPSDDISVLVLSVVPKESEDKTRRLNMRFPINPVLL